MFGTEEEESKSLIPTNFDTCRLEALEIGDKLQGELDNWTVFRYRNSWDVILSNKNKRPMLSFKTLDNLLAFLNKTR